MHKPDLTREDIAAKRSNADRVKEFAKNLNAINMQAMKDEAARQAAQEAELEALQRKRQAMVERQMAALGADQQAMQVQQAGSAPGTAANARARAAEYASKIPRPAVRPSAPSEPDALLETASNRRPSRIPRGAGGTGRTGGAGGGEGGGRVIKLEELEAAHDAARHEVEAMRREFGM